MRIVIDSNIICADWRLASSTSRVFLDGLARTGDSLYVPQLVLDEAKNKYAEELQRCKSQIDSLVSKIGRMADRPFSSPIADADVGPFLEEYGQTLGARLLRAGATILDYPAVPHQTVVQRALARRKPFSESDKGYRDFLIWQSVVGIAESGNEPVAFITRNRKDFADDELHLHPDLVVDIQERELEPDRVVLFQDLEQFVNAHVKPAMEVLEDVRRQLSAGEYPGLNLQRVLSDRLFDLIAWNEVEPDEIGFPPEFENPTVSGVYDPYDIEVTDVRRLSSGEFLVETEANVECEFDFFVFKADLYAMDLEEAASVSDYDWNRHYAAASATKEVNIVVYLTFDAGSGEVTSMEMQSITQV